MRHKLTTLSSTHKSYDPREFEPPSEKAWRYMASLPYCQDMPEGIFFLPDEACAYCLPTEATKIQLDYLERLIYKYRKEEHPLPANFFKSIPGVADVLFEEDVHFMAEEVRMYGYFWSAYVGAEKKTSRFFDVGTHLRFEPTIIGAITAYFFASFPSCRGYSLISNKDNDRSWWLGRTFGEALSANVPIPWGLRIEVLSKGHYIVSCLGFSNWDLVDHNVEVKDGQALIHHGFYYCLNPTAPKPSRETTLIQAFRNKDKIIV